jgi:hypothetical protein
MTILTTLMLLPWLSILPIFFKVAVVILVTVVASELSVDNITIYNTCTHVLMIATRFLYLYYQRTRSSIVAVIRQTRQQCLVLGKFLSPYHVYEVSGFKNLIF